MGRVQPLLRCRYAGQDGGDGEKGEGQGRGRCFGRSAARQVQTTRAAMPHRDADGNEVLATPSRHMSFRITEPAHLRMSAAYGTVQPGIAKVGMCLSRRKLPPSNAGRVRSVVAAATQASHEGAVAVAVGFEERGAGTGCGQRPWRLALMMRDGDRCSVHRTAWGHGGRADVVDGS